MVRVVPPDMRNHFTRNGDVKTKFSEAGARRLGAMIGQEPYQCLTCFQWHLATIKPPPKRKKKR